jgi:hypothetical protein
VQLLPDQVRQTAVTTVGFCHCRVNVGHVTCLFSNLAMLSQREWRWGDEEGVKKTDDDDAEAESLEVEFESKTVKMLDGFNWV